MPTDAIDSPTVVDAIDLAALDVEARSELVALHPTAVAVIQPSLGEWAALWHERLDIAHGDDYFVLVARLVGTNEPVGYVTGGGSRDHDGKSGAEIYSLFVERSHRRKGLGSQLLRRCINTMVEAKYSDATIWVPAENRGAIDFFLAHEFTREPLGVIQEIEGFEIKSDRCRLAFS